MSLQSKISKLENYIQTRFSSEMKKTDRALVLYMQLLDYDMGNKKHMAEVPDKMKVTHADWDLLYKDALSKKDSYKSEESFKEYMDFIYEIKASIDEAHGWKY